MLNGSTWVLSVLSLVVLGSAIYSDDSMGVMYGVAECGLFKCRNWLFEDPADNDDCNARVRMTKVAQLSIFFSSLAASLTITASVLNTLSFTDLVPPLLMRYKAHLHAVTATLCFVSWLMITIWYTKFLCHRQYSDYQDSRIGSAVFMLPVGIIAESILAKNSWKKIQVSTTKAPDV